MQQKCEAILLLGTRQYFASINCFIKMKVSLVLGILLIFGSCNTKSQTAENGTQELGLHHLLSKKVKGDVNAYYEQHKSCAKPSKPIGTVSNGGLVNGVVMPFSGVNFSYFDTTSYLSGRAFSCDVVVKSVVDAYKYLEQAAPQRHFYIMECSHKNGGKLFPHRTHQNGLSVDFMMPKLKNGKPYTTLDQMGAQHYWLSFDDNGAYKKDTAITIDFDLIAQHLLLLNKTARAHGLKIKKVIIKVEFKDELFSTPNGKKLKKSGVYIVNALSPLINELHDEHYHVDFEVL